MKNPGSWLKPGLPPTYKILTRRNTLGRPSRTPDKDIVLEGLLVVDGQLLIRTPQAVVPPSNLKGERFGPRIAWVLHKYRESLFETGREWPEFKNCADPTNCNNF